MLPLGRQHARLERLGPREVLDRDRGLRAEAIDELRVERLQPARMARRDLQHADHAVARDQRRAEHRRLARVARRRGRRGCSRAARRAASTGLPVHACQSSPWRSNPWISAEASIGSSSASSGSVSPIWRLRAFVQAICSATRRSVSSPLSRMKQRRRVIVVGQRSEAVEDLVEEILRMDQLHDLAIDAVAHVEHPLAIHRLDRHPTTAAVIRASSRPSS